MSDLANDVESPNFGGEGTKAKIIFEEIQKLLPVNNI